MPNLVLFQDVPNDESINGQMNLQGQKVILPRFKNTKTPFSVVIITFSNRA